MRILLWHGWLLEGTGSNIYTARTAEAYRRAGHDVLLLCLERGAERFDFVDEAGEVGPEGIAWQGRNASAAPAPGRVRVLRPRFGSLLPVFVEDEYEGFEVKAFPRLSDHELAGYLDRNVEALRVAAAAFGPEAAIAGHAVPGAAIARRALGDGAYVAKIHGSDLEYAIRVDARYGDLAREGLEGAVAVTGATRDVLARTEALLPGAARRTILAPPGVDVERFRPGPGPEALREAADRLEHDPAAARGRPSSLDDEVAAALARRDADGLDALAGRYDQAAPDPGAHERLRSLAAGAGPLVGYLGKLITQKGVHLLLQALALLPAPPRALLVGFGTYREWLVAMARALDAGDAEAAAWVAKRSGFPLELGPGEVAAAAGLAGRLTFTGRLDHRYAPSALAAVDVLVVSSVLEEAFGMVAAEAAAAGALPLAARHSGLAEVVRALEDAVGRPGLLSFEPGPGAARRLAQKLEALLALPGPERAELGAAVSAFVGRTWTWGRTAERLLEAATAR